MQRVHYVCLILIKIGMSREFLVKLPSVRLSQNTLGILELLHADDRRTDMAKLRITFLQRFAANAPYAMKYRAHYLHRMIQNCHYIYVLKSDGCDFIHYIMFLP
jgi:hypothetical protein